MISPHTIQNILETARIEDVVGDFVNLKKRGANYIGLCPFHDEKTPSFNVNPVRGIFKCFGCGKGGDAITFLREHESYSYVEALQWLAQKYNIEIEETKTSNEEIVAKQIKEGLYIVNNFAQQYYTDNLLHSDEGKSIGLTYFKERGFREVQIKKFQLGYALKKEDAFSTTATIKGYQLEMLVQAGLTKQYESGNTRDFIHGRVIFPIQNLSGKIVGFAGRVLKKEEKTSKYINSPETEIYHKSKILYGIFQAKSAIRQFDECYLVEGYTDVISMHQAGIENVVASSGTSLTPDQIKLIKRFTPNVTILYDGDPAGIKAALRGLEMVLEEDMNVRIVLLPDGEDPDSFVQKNGTTPFREYVKANATNVVAFKANQLLAEAGNDPIRNATAIREIVGTLAKVPDTIKRQLLTRECSRILKVDERILITEINKIKRGQFSKESKQELAAVTKNELRQLQEIHDTQKRLADGKDEPQERDLVRILLEFGQKQFSEETTVAQYILKEVGEHQFYHPLLQKIKSLFQAELQKGNIPDHSFFMQQEDESLRDIVLTLLTSPYQLSENWEKRYEIYVTDKTVNYKKDVESSLHRFKIKLLDRMIRENAQEIKTAEQDKNEEALRQHLQVKKQLNDLKGQLAKVIGTVVLK